MDAASYFANRPPQFKKRSKIAPFKSDILEYKARGYTLSELQAFLAVNGITISPAGISAYIRRQEQGQSMREEKKAASVPKATTTDSNTKYNRPAGFGSFPIKPDREDL